MEANNNDDKLLDEDLDYLKEKGYDYEVSEDDKGNIYIIVHSFPFGESYRPTSADLLVVLPAGYPNARVDMFFTRPDVLKVNGDWPDRCAAKVTQNGQTWQQWSRHFQEWRPGVDNLRSYFAAVSKEIKKGI